MLAVAEDDIVRDSLIQRFEFTYELGWKAMFYWLRDQGERVPETGYWTRFIAPAAAEVLAIDAAPPKVWAMRSSSPLSGITGHLNT